MLQETVGGAVRCTICGAPSTEIVRLKEGFSAQRCGTCSAVFAQPMPGEKELEEYYSKWMFALPPEEKVEQWRSHTRKGADEIMKLIAAQRTGPVRSVLDYGGGLGFFARAFADHIADVHLFDMSAASCEYARSAFAPHLTVHDEAGAALAAGPFDLILVNQVIEHVIDPVSFVKPLLAALAPGGTIIVTTPNNRMFDAAFRLDLFARYAGNSAAGRARGALKLIEDSWLCLDPPRHLYAFSAQSLERAMETAGGETQRIFTRTYQNDPLGYPMYDHRPKGIPKRLIALYRRMGSALAGLIDRRGVHGNTLIGFFGVGGSTASDGAIAATR